MNFFDIQLNKTLRNVHSSFSVNFTLQSSAQCVAVIGASGCGKSLMLQMIAGLIRPDDGYIRINQRTLFNQHNAYNMPTQKRRIGLMFQDYALFPHLTVIENIAFGLHSGCLKKKSVQNQCQEWLEIMQLNHVAHHYPHQISGGQKQRTALARTLITQPDCLLLDEPFCALDAPLRQQMRQHLFDLQKNINTPLLLVTHDIADAQALNAQTWQINQGVLQKMI